MLLLTFLPVSPANAETNVISIDIAESITRHDTYQPTGTYTDGVVVPGAASGTGTVTLTNNAGVPLYDVVIVFNTGQTTPASWAYSSGDAATLTAGAGTMGVSVKNFAAGHDVVLTYGLNPATAVPPVALTTTYTRNVITNSVASNTVVHLTATANGAALPSDVASVAPTVTIASADSATLGVPGTPDWTLSSAFTAPASGSSLTWSPAAIPAGGSSTIDVTATVNEVAALNDGNSGVALYDIATSTVTYTINSNVGSSSGVRVNSATGSTTEVISKIEKQFNSATGQWEFTPKVSTPVASNIAYDLASISEWAVSTSDLNAVIAGPQTIDSGNHDASHPTWPALVDGSNPFTATGTELLSFAYNGVPVGFMKPVISIRDTNNQFPKTGSSTANGVDLLKRIYIINGYQVEVVKAITPGAAAGEYHIHIVATNLGTAATPPSVVVYDIVPTAFYSLVAPVSPTNMVPAATGNSPVASGQAYYWNIGSLAANGQPGDSATIDYDVTGTGSYATSDLFVVGVDPAQSLNLQTTPLLTNASTLVNANFEMLAALAAAGLLIVGTVGTARRRQ